MEWICKNLFFHFSLDGHKTTSIIALFQFNNA